MNKKSNSLFMKIRFEKDGFLYHIGYGYDSDDSIRLIENGRCETLNELIQRIMAARYTSKIDESSPKALGIDVKDKINVKDIFRV